MWWDCFNRIIKIIDTMSNTYAKLKVHKTDPKFMNYPEVNYDMELTLTAFVWGDYHTQLTVQTISDSNQGGVGFITLGDKEVDLLIAALLERKLGKISATGDEQSNYCPNYKEEMLWKK